MAMKSEIEAALKAHAAWREHFKDILNGRAAFDLATIGATDHCVFGQWLDNEGHRMMPSELHDEICIVHQEFHQIAADIIQMIKDKRYTEAHEAISLDGALNRKSMRLKELLVKLSFREPPVAKIPAQPDEQAPGAQSAEESLPPPKDEILLPNILD